MASRPATIFDFKGVEEAEEADGDGDRRMVPQLLQLVSPDAVGPLQLGQYLFPFPLMVPQLGHTSEAFDGSWEPQFLQNI